MLPLKSVTILLCAFFLFFPPSSAFSEKDTNTDPPTSCIDTYFYGQGKRLCFDLLIKAEIDLLAKRGGYYKIPEDRLLLTESDSMVFYGIDGKFNVPTLPIIERELADLIRFDTYGVLNMNKCKPQEIGFNIEDVQTAIQEEAITVKIRYSMNTGKEAQKKSYQFEKTIESGFFDLYQAAISYIETLKSDPNYIVVSALIELTKENDSISAEFWPIEDGSHDIVYYFIQKEPQPPLPQRLTYRFVVRYNW